MSGALGSMGRKGLGLVSALGQQLICEDTSSVLAYLTIPSQRRYHQFSVLVCTPVGTAMRRVNLQHTTSGEECLPGARPARYF